MEDGNSKHSRKKRALEVHRGLFVDWVPEKVTALAYSPSGTHLAVARGNGNIEIWDARAFSHVVTLFGSGPDFHARSLLWIEDDSPAFDNDAYRALGGGRLFSSGLDGDIVEWDFATLFPLARVRLGAGGIWAMDAVRVRVKVELEESSDEEDDQEDGEQNGNKKTKSKKMSDENQEDEEEHFVEEIHIAIVTEDGMLRIYRPNIKGGLLYLTSSLRVKSRMMSVSWSPNADLIAVGCGDGSIQTYRYEASKVGTEETAIETLYKMSCHRPTSNTEVQVWSVKVLKDNTVVSGSSTGRTEFWDGNSGVLITSFQKNEADIVAITTNADETTVFTASFDTKLTIYRLIETNTRDAVDVDQTFTTREWAFDQSRRHHTHDINALAIVAMPKHVLLKVKEEGELLLVTGGNDTILIAHQISADSDIRHIQRITSFPSRKFFSTTRDPNAGHNLLSSMNNKSIKIWRLGSSFTDPADLNTARFLSSHAHKSNLPIKEFEELLCDFQMASATNLSCHALSPDGNFLAVSDCVALRLFRLKISGQKNRLSVLKVKLPEAFQEAASSVAFSANSSKLFVATFDSSIKVFELRVTESDEMEAESITVPVLIKTFRDHQSSLTTSSSSSSSPESSQDGEAAPEHAPIRFLSVSADGQWLSSVDTLNRTFIFSLDSLSAVARLPVFESTIIDVAIHPSQSIAFVLTSDLKYHLVDIESDKLINTDLNQNIWRKSFRTDTTSGVKGVVFNPSNPATFFCFSEKVSCFSDINKIRESHTKKPFSFTDRYNPVLFADFFGPNQLLVVERPWAHVLAQVPDPVLRRKFGTQ